MLILQKFKWLKRSMLTLMSVQALSLIASIMQLNLLYHLPVSMAEAKSNDLRVSCLARAFLIVYVITAIIFSRWIITAHKTVRSFDAQGMSISPGWAVGYFFVPFINLVRPYVAMKELWCASLDPKNPSAQPVSSLLPTWWAFWLVNGVLGYAIWGMSSNLKDIETIRVFGILSVASHVLGLTLSWVAFSLAKRITTNITAHSEPPPLLA